MRITIVSKLKYVGLTFVAMVIASMCLGNSVNAATTIKYNPQMTDEELRKSIAESNKVTDIINEGGYYRHVQVQGIDELDYFDNVLGDNNYILRLSNCGDNSVDTRLAGFGYYAPFPGKKIVRLYDDELWQYSINSRVTGSWDEVYNPYEYYTERYLNNGMLYIRSRITRKGLPMDVLESSGVDVSRKIDFIELFREVDPETLRIRKDIEYVKYADENELRQYICAVQEYYEDNPRKEIESQLYDEVFGGERHTIKIIVNSGTQDEQEYSIAANKDSYLDYWIRNSNRKYDIYIDPECTIPAEVDESGLIKFDSDKILYMN